MTRLEVVLPVHNRRETTLRALGSLARLDTDGVDLHVTVVDDGSADGTAEAIAAQHPAVAVVTGDGSLFYAGGTNLGLRHALARDPDFVIMANDDAVFSRDLVQQLLAVAAVHPDAVVGALLLRSDLPHMAFQVGQAWDTWYGGWRVPQRLTAFSVPPVPWEVESLAGNCLLVPAAVLRREGLLDARRFPHHWADAEFSARLRRAGHRLLVAPRARVFCEPNTYPAPLHTIGWTARTFALWRNRFHPLHLGGQWRLRWHTAPARWQGIAAMAIFTCRLALRVARLGAWPDWPDPPLGRPAAVPEPPCES